MKKRIFSKNYLDCNKKSILLTGITGFIGRNIAKNLLLFENYFVTAIVRPGTKIEKFQEFNDKINIVFINLADKEKLSIFLQRNSFDCILHIAALRGGRNVNKKEFFKVNVTATELLVENAVKNKSKFIYCSSVGVYGTIPLELPATLNTPYQEDNCYHKTKIICEKLILKNVTENHLLACIVRPAITYGKDDFGFPYTFVKLVQNRLLFLPKTKLYIHMLNVKTAAEVFVKLVDTDFDKGKIWNLADKEKVCIQELADFVKKGNYKTLPNFCFKIFLILSKIFKNELWVSRFELISKSWYFDVDDIYNDLSIESCKTIPDIQLIIDN